MYAQSRANPIFLPGGSTAVLCIHGFTGHPGEFSYLAHSLHRRGYSVSVPRLPGHGTSGEDFRSSHWKDWLGHAREAYRRLRESCETVFLVGLSMGGLIAVMLAHEYPPRGLVLCAPAFKIRALLVHIAELTGLFCTKIPRLLPSLSQRERDYFEKEYQMHYWPRHTGYIVKLTRRANTAFPSISTPTLTLLSVRDKVVPLSVHRHIRKHISHSQIVFLKESGHVVVDNGERELVSKYIEAFIEKNRPI